eukprot:TRINITY_DN237_c0_g1_i1.p1 TRINITY_DN237_c0_g1~~TRINITY_DN237_c0_g1_i1.p1  ORF type:complete len:182 (+),score=28.97 TRINITY_DN237_c0_g1_i1:51-548(+)
MTEVITHTEEQGLERAELVSNVRSHFDGKKPCQQKHDKTRQQHKGGGEGGEPVPAPKQRAAATHQPDASNSPVPPSFRCFGSGYMLGALREEAHHDKRTHVYRILEDLEPTRQAVLVTLLDTTVLRDQPAPTTHTALAHSPASEDELDQDTCLQTIDTEGLTPTL